MIIIIIIILIIMMMIMMMMMMVIGCQYASSNGWCCPCQCPKLPLHHLVSKITGLYMIFIISKHKRSIG